MDIPQGSGLDEEPSVNTLGKPCVGKLQARFDEKVLETSPIRVSAPAPYSIKITNSSKLTEPFENLMSL